MNRYINAKKWLSLCAITLSLTQLNANAADSKLAPSNDALADWQHKGYSQDFDAMINHYKDNNMNQMLNHGIDTSKQESLKSSTNFQYLNYLSYDTIDSAEEYYAARDPYIHPTLSGVSLSFNSTNTLRVTGVTSITDLNNKFEQGMQIRLYFVNKEGARVSQTRTIEAVVGFSGNYFLAFEHGFNSDTQSYFNNDWERVGQIYSLEKFKQYFNLYENGSNVAAYTNAADLGFGRRMVGKSSGDEVYFYVSNYANANQANDPNAIPVATVAMTYGDVDGLPGNQTTFYVFDNDRRIINIDLDGNGVKQIPGLCQNCHQDRFISFDLDSFGYPSANPRANQETAFKYFNDLVKLTNPTPESTALIDLWYQNGNTQNSSAVPSEWQNADQDVYTEVVKPYCRTCHITLNYRDPIKHDRFISNANYFMYKLCDSYNTMPHAKVTHENLLNDNAALSTLTNRFYQSIPCWQGTATLSNFNTSHSTIDINQNSNITVTRSVHATELVNRFEVQLVRNSDNNCLNFTTGSIKGQKNDQVCWQDMSFYQDPIAANYAYISTENFNPSSRYNNWQEGNYQLHIRAWGAQGQLSNTTSHNFSLEQEPPSLSNFSLNQTTYNKQDPSLVSYRYQVDSTQPVTSFKRAIKRLSDNQWINPATGLTTNYSSRYSDWNVLSLTSTSGGNYHYEYAGSIYPQSAYANWQESSYRLYTIAENASGQTSTEQYLNFYVVNNPIAPSITSWYLNPYSMYKNSTSNVNFSYSLEVSQPLVSMERKIVRNSDGRCINPATGQSGSCWHDYTALSQTSSNPIRYGISGSLVPATAYANWNTGYYRIYVRGKNAQGVSSNQRYLNFRLR